MHLKIDFFVDFGNVMSTPNFSSWRSLLQQWTADLVRDAIFVSSFGAKWSDSSHLLHVLQENIYHGSAFSLCKWFNDTNFGQN